MLRIGLLAQVFGFVCVSIRFEDMYCSGFMQVGSAFLQWCCRIRDL